jgi:hypothetical protein
VTADPVVGALGALAGGDPSSAIQTLAAAGVQRVTVRSAFSPDYSFSPFAPGAPPGGGQPGGASAFVAWLQPEVILDGVFGTQRWAPAGSPTANYVPHLAGAGAGLLSIFALLLGNVGVAKVAGLAALAFVGAGEAENRGWLK